MKTRAESDGFVAAASDGSALRISPEVLRAVRSKGAVYAAGVELLIQRGDVIIEPQRRQ